MVASSRLRASGCRHFLQQQQPSYLTRIWCVFEVFVTASEGIPSSVVVAHSDGASSNYTYVDELISDCVVDAANATASVKQDEDDIEKLIIEKHGSFVFVNNVVQKSLWMSLLERRQSQLEGD